MKDINAEMVSTINTKYWQKRLTILTFMFFLVKGLLWLAIPFASAYFLF